jgi:DUF4097 and DUF4098 domain-containing protein YvlB
MKTAGWIAALVWSLSVTAAADVKDTEELTYTVDPGARISLENINGDITVTGGSGNQVEIVAHKKAGKQEYLDEMKIVVDAEDDYIRIETRHPEREGGWFKWTGDTSGSVSYELSVPADVTLDTIETVNGDVMIRAVSGTVKAATVNGSLNIENLVGDVSLETVNGSISAEFDALTGSQRVDAETVNGKIALRLPEEASARVTAETVNGSIDCDDFGLKPEKGFVGRDLSGDIGDGAARISLDTVNGSIRINRK